ncbi:hypothetical protein CS022_14320 [Veronia nyctiphanis]|uniref:Uncharacterized protein n=1 Tax=Veronia nyctiphanis TaxID=1278244 RepID=A0A4Q0YUC9_9GAMM|nr:hypothetical protein CS022_14320 [Veronia nyctiphanis]
MSKTLCEWRNATIVKDLKKLRKLVAEPNVVCSKCARVANTKKVLCKPISLKK